MCRFVSIGWCAWKHLLGVLLVAAAGHTQEACPAKGSVADCVPVSQDQVLAKELRRIEAQYLKGQLTANQKAKPGTG